MRVLHVNDSALADGGVGRYIGAVTGLLASAGHAGWLAYQHEGRHGDASPIELMNGMVHVPQDADLGARVDRLFETVRPDVAFIHYVDDPELVKKVARHVPTIGFAHGFRQVCPGQAKLLRVGDEVCTRRFGAGCVPSIYLRRCAGAKHPASVARIMRRAARQRDAFMSLSRVLVAGAYMRVLLEQNGFSRDRLIELAPHFDEPRAVRPADSLPRMVLFSGRLEYEKGLPYLLRAMASSHGSWRLEIAGEGSLRPEYEALAVRLGIHERIRFHGWLNDSALDDVYARATLLAMPSLMPEPFGKSGIDALARGRPVVAFAVGGIVDWLVDGETGMLVPPRDATALGEAIDELVTDEERWHPMSEAARRTVAQRFAPHDHLAALIDAFDCARREWAA